MVSGSTATVVLITHNKIYCANCGDSRTVLNNAKAESNTVPLSFDHKPNNYIEKARIMAASHFVMMNRVDACLALSRAFGDFIYKDKDLPPEQQAVSAFPDVTVRDRDENDLFIVIACDGIWDCLSNSECIKLFSYKISKLKSLEDSNEKLYKPIEDVFDKIMAETT